MYLHIITLIVIGIAFPAYSIVTGEKTRQFLTEFPEKKISVYHHTIGIQVVFMVLIIISMWSTGNDIHEIGLTFLNNLILVLAIPTICFLILWIFNKISITKQKAEKFLEDSKDVIYILPSTNKEYKWTVVVSLIAGTFEEIIFRGYLYWQIEQYMSIIPAILLTNIIFGLSHYGTKFKNAFSAFILGTIWSVIYYFSGSLWLAIVIHICIDFYSSTFARKSFRLKEGI